MNDIWFVTTTGLGVVEEISWVQEGLSRKGVPKINKIGVTRLSKTQLLIRHTGKFLCTETMLFGGNT